MKGSPSVVVGVMLGEEGLSTTSEAQEGRCCNVSKDQLMGSGGLTGPAVTCAIISRVRVWLSPDIIRDQNMEAPS